MADTPPIPAHLGTNPFATPAHNSQTHIPSTDYEGQRPISFFPTALAGTSSFPSIPISSLTMRQELRNPASENSRAPASREESMRNRGLLKRIRGRSGKRSSSGGASSPVLRLEPSSAICHTARCPTTR